jgi:hypothetical protein
MRIMVVIATLVYLLFAPFLAWPQGYTIHQVTYPKSVETRAVGINDRPGARGDVVGSYNDGTMDPTALAQYAKWGSSYVPVHPSGPCGDAQVTGLNNRRVIIGLGCVGYEGYGFVHVGATKEHPETHTEIIRFPNMASTEALGINDAGDIVGIFHSEETQNNHPYLLQGEIFTELPAIPGWEITPADINNVGQIAGTIYEYWTGTTWGFLYENGEYEFFEVGGYGWVHGLNDHGHIVGSYFVFEYYDDNINDVTCCWRGFLFKDSTFTTINATKDASTTAAGINNAGHIAGTFYRPGDDWKAHGFVAVPKPAKVVKR